MKQPVLRRLMFLGFQGLRAAASLLPLPAASVLGRALGSAAFVLLWGQRRLAERHLAYAFGEQLSAAERRRIAHGVFRNLGETMMEWLALPRFSSSDLKRLIACEGLEHVRQALARGNGVIALTGHFGNWELIAPYLISLGFEGAVLARRLRYPEYESFLLTLRGSKGVATIARGSLKDVATLLRDNQIVGVLPDQDVDSLEGIFVNFFGHPTYTPVGPAALSLMTGAPIVPLFVIREGGRVRLVIEPPLRVPEGADRAQALTSLTQAWSDVVESYIRRYPDHWVWMHRRWKTQPPAAAAQGSGLWAEGSCPEPRAPSLSVTLIVLCCLASALVAGCVKPSHPKKTAVPAAAAPEVGQQMSEFALTGYGNGGAARWKLNGRGATLDGNIVTIHQPDGVGFEPGRTAYLTASAAQMNQQDRHVRLEHDVTIHTSDGLWVSSPVLHWIPDRNEVATDQPVRFETDHMLLRGRELTGFTQMKQATLLHDIELVLNPGGHEGPSSGPRQVTITCDGPLAFDYEHNVATFEQNVHVKDPSGDLYSDKLVAYLDQATHTIRYAEAIGRVRILQEKNTARSERAVYEPAVGKITLVGKPSLLIYPSSGEKTTQPSFGGLIAAPGTAAHAPAQGPKEETHQ